MVLITIHKSANWCKKSNGKIQKGERTVRQQYSGNRSGDYSCCKLKRYQPWGTLLGKKSIFKLHQSDKILF